MKSKQTKTIIFGALLSLAASSFSSCKPLKHLEVSGIAYQSICAEHSVLREDIPSDASIIVYCTIDKNGQFDVTIKNNTDKIMIIDRGRTFFRDGNNNSVPYYDPTIVVNTQSTTIGGSTGASVNLGSIANAAGIGGVVGTALGGINVSGSSGSATTNTETTFIIDQEKIPIAPHGKTSLGRVFKITGVGKEFLSTIANSAQQDVNNSFAPGQSYAMCNLCVSYSLDDGKDYETIITDIYANTLMVNKVWQNGNTNDALRKLYTSRSDVLSANWFMLYFESESKENNSYYKTTPIVNCK